MDQQREAIWLKKAGRLRFKYEHNKYLVINNLQLLRPRMFNSYDYKRSQICLFLYHLISRQQAFLYTRFIEGTRYFLSKTEVQGSDSLLRVQLEKVNAEGESLLTVIHQELKTLSSLDSLFRHLEERGLIAKKIVYQIVDQAALEKIIEEMMMYVSSIPPGLQKSIHKKIIIQYSLENEKMLHIKETVELFRGKLDGLLSSLSNENAQKEFGLVAYVLSSLAFFFGLLRYEDFSAVSTLARQLALR